MQDYGQWQGQSGGAGSRDPTRAAFQAGMIQDGEKCTALRIQG